MKLWVPRIAKIRRSLFPSTNEKFTKNVENFNEFIELGESNKAEAELYYEFELELG